MCSNTGLPSSGIRDPESGEKRRRRLRLVGGVSRQQLRQRLHRLRTAAPGSGCGDQLQNAAAAGRLLRETAGSSCVVDEQQQLRSWTAAISSRSWKLRRRLRSAPRRTAVLVAGLRQRQQPRWTAVALTSVGAATAVFQATEGSGYCSGSGGGGQRQRRCSGSSGGSRERWQRSGAAAAAAARPVAAQTLIRVLGCIVASSRSSFFVFSFLKAQVIYNCGLKSLT